MSIIEEDFNPSFNPKYIEFYFEIQKRVLKCDTSLEKQKAKIEHQLRNDYLNTIIVPLISVVGSVITMLSTIIAMSTEPVTKKIITITLFLFLGLSFVGMNIGMKYDSLKKDYLKCKLFIIEELIDKKKQRNNQLCYVHKKQRFAGKR